MAHYAFLDDNNNVVEVIVGKEENEDGVNWEQHYGNFRGLKCKRTSYNTYGNQHKLDGIPFRKNYASIGYRYDESLDAFISPIIHPSWILNTETCLWEPPVPYPTDGKFYSWFEANQEWIELK
jgi:hypothetical protein